MRGIFRRRAEPELTIPAADFDAGQWLAPIAVPAAAELSETRRRAGEGSWHARLQLAVASRADGDDHAAVALVRSALAAGDEALALGASLLREWKQWRSLVDLVGERWRLSGDLPAGEAVLAAHLELKQIEPAETLLHELNVRLARSGAGDAQALRQRLRDAEFVLDGMRVTRHSAGAPTVQLYEAVELLLPTPLWRSPDVELGLANGPRVGVVPLAFHPSQSLHTPYARAFPIWMAHYLSTRTTCDVTTHFFARNRGAVADLHVQPDWELLLDMTGLAGADPIVVAGMLHCRGDDRFAEVEIWYDGRRTAVITQNVGQNPGYAARKIARRLAGALPAERAPSSRLMRPGALAVPGENMLDELIPALADSLDLTLGQLGAQPYDLVDRRRARIDRLLAVAERFPADLDARLFAVGLLALMKRRGSPIALEFSARVDNLPPLRHPWLEQLETVLD